MFFLRRTIPGLAIHSYIIGDLNSKKAVIIDPVRDVDDYVKVAKKNDLEIEYILETHVHADYVSGAHELKTKLKGKPKIYCSGMGGKAWIPSYADVVVQDGDEFQFGILKFKAVHTPGHTPEHLMWVLIENDTPIQLFTGDFLFVGDVGRPDLLGQGELNKLSHQLYHSVFNVLDHYSDTVEIHPAHGAGSLCGKSLSVKPSSTLGLERKQNLSLKKKSETQWIEELMLEMPKAPKYFHRMKKINIQGPNLIGEIRLGHHPISPIECKNEIAKGAVVLDLRSKEEFAEGHIPGSINIPFGPQLSTWIGSLIDPQNPLIFVLESEGYLEEAVMASTRIGFDDIIGYLEGGVEAWEHSHFDINVLNTLSPDDLNEFLKKEPLAYILDVRTNKEWREGHIKNAVHIPVGEVLDNLDKLPHDRPISVICGSGVRSSIVSSLLQRGGFFNVTHIFGGMRGWCESGFSVSFD